ncbi:hypothetical protein E2C01_044403 [Portunus trituberculatus]|uniref:Uncharacterized protein n=1 Tax=Portunus trituberculatus TaxID=210409 RepID=A0A5B7G279_PORTR|nr:hypothetical protein [Portunus trituberculatus]
MLYLSIFCVFTYLFIFDLGIDLPSRRCPVPSPPGTNTPTPASGRGVPSPSAFPLLGPVSPRMTRAVRPLHSLRPLPLAQICLSHLYLTALCPFRLLVCVSVCFLTCHKIAEKEEEEEEEEEEGYQAIDKVTSSQYFMNTQVKETVVMAVVVVVVVVMVVVVMVVVMVVVVGSEGECHRNSCHSSSWVSAERVAVREGTGEREEGMNTVTE